MALTLFITPTTVNVVAVTKFRKPKPVKEIPTPTTQLAMTILATRGFCVHPRQSFTHGPESMPPAMRTMSSVKASNSLEYSEPTSKKGGQKSSARALLYKTRVLASGEWRKAAGCQALGFGEGCKRTMYSSEQTLART